MCQAKLSLYVCEVFIFIAGDWHNISVMSKGRIFSLYYLQELEVTLGESLP
jgi:hypothetical protein